MRLIALMIMAGFAAMLLSGCLAGMKERQQPVQPVQTPGGSLGDAEISPGQSDEDVEVPGEDLLPPPPDVSVPAASLDPSLLDIDISEEDPVIAEEDFIEPP